MRVTVTAGTGGCQHVTIRNAATGEIIYHATRAELREAARDGDGLLMQMRLVVKQAGASTAAQIKAAIEAADFI